MEKEKLSEKVNAYCESLGTTAVAILKGKTPNPFPKGVGIRAVYYASAPNAKYPISAAQSALFELFFLNLENENPKEKQLANWIYYEESDDFYCSECIEKRLEEVNENKEFADEIDYDGGDTCGYMRDYAYEGAGEDIECCRCGAPLFSIDSDT